MSYRSSEGRSDINSYLKIVGNFAPAEKWQMKMIKKPIVPTMRQQAKDILAKLTKGQAVEDHEVESLKGATPEELGEMEIVKPKTALGHSRVSHSNNTWKWSDFAEN